MKKEYLQTLWQLIKEDFTISKKTLRNEIINTHIWSSIALLVSGYLFADFGISSSYGPLMIGSLLTSCCGFRVFLNVSSFVSDLEGPQTLHYYLTLPLPSWLVFVKLIINYAINAAIITLFFLPISKIILWNQFDITQVNIIKLLIIYVVSCVFFGSFYLFLASFVPGMRYLSNMLMRIWFPLWYLGGFHFPWKSMLNFSPALAYLNLLNPYTHSMEGMRSALLGPENFLPFWFNIAALVMLGIVFGWIGIVRLKRRLDFV